MAAPGSHLGLSESRTCAFNHYIALITVIPNKYVLKTPTNFITGNIGFGIIPITRRGKTNLRPSRISKDQNALRIINLVIPFKPSVIWNNGYSRGKAKQIEKESILKGIWLRSSEAIIRCFGQIKCKSDGVTSMLNCPWMASHPNTSPRTSSGYMASSLISSTCLPPSHSPLLQLHQTLSCLNIPRSPQHLLSFCPHCVEPLSLQASCSASSSTIRSQLNVLPQTDLLASVASKSHWPPPPAIPLHHTVQLYVLQCTYLYLVVNCLLLALEWSSIGEAGTLSSLFRAAPAPIAVAGI